jgi:hypothetical protein
MIYLKTFSAKIVVLSCLLYLIESAKLNVVVKSSVKKGENYSFNFTYQPLFKTTTNHESFISLVFTKDNKEYFKLDNNTDCENCPQTYLKIIYS